MSFTYELKWEKNLYIQGYLEIKREGGCLKNGKYHQELNNVCSVIIIYN